MPTRARPRASSSDDAGQVVHDGLGVARILVFTEAIAAHLDHGRNLAAVPA
ncbi:MAG TPA: hypothetical protein VFN87_22150 [Solirubrobacteraceae bacterium]|nr:hypothetical protein [Solirubrobacteraceae bacterium]